MKEINKSRLTETFVSLVGIDSLSYNERELADELTLRLKKLGLDVFEDDAGAKIGGNAGNLFARLPANTPEAAGGGILFSAHMDTVEPGIGKKAVIHEDGTITSEGNTVLGADDAGGIAEILEALEEVIEEDLPHPTIELFFPVAEEAYCIGSNAFDLSRVTAESAYFLDRSGEVGSATTSEPSLYKFSVEVEGRASHSGFSPEEGVNAILIASRAVSKLPIGRVDSDTTLAIGTIRGGVATNVVPDYVLAEGEIRSRSDTRAREMLSVVEQTFNEEALALGGKAKLFSKKHLNAYNVEADSKAMSAYRAVLDDLGIAFAPEDSFGGSDANAFRAGGIDAICVANAMHNIHTVNEYTTISEMETVTFTIKKLMTRIQG
ncbi:MAG: M20/M25/M40 family metallo-hydrolase [Lachnospiraceae bacterium]|nr:M20/M25/M40 family metallo-hydrolase [Lachnospiraceae bacterium]